MPRYSLNTELRIFTPIILSRKKPVNKATKITSKKKSETKTDPPIAFVELASASISVLVPIVEQILAEVYGYVSFEPV